MTTATFHGPVLMAAFAVAMKARFGGLSLHDVDDMRTKAEELLPKDDPFRPAVLAFASMYEVEARDPVALAVLGEALNRAVLYATDPGPRLPLRSDIDG